MPQAVEKVRKQKLSHPCSPSGKCSSLPPPLPVKRNLNHEIKADKILITASFRCQSKQGQEAVDVYLDWGGHRSSKLLLQSKATGYPSHPITDDRLQVQAFSLFPIIHFHLGKVPPPSALECPELTCRNPSAVGGRWMHPCSAHRSFGRTLQTPLGLARRIQLQQRGPRGCS